MVQIQPVENVETVADFIAHLNADQTQHVGYCGTDAKEILHTLKTDFSDLPLEDSFFAAFDEGRLVGVLGIDYDEDTHEGEVWGPFVSHADWERVSELLWQHVMERHGQRLKKLLGFYNSRNEKCQSFMTNLNAEKGRNDVILKLNREVHSVKGELSVRICELTEENFPAFKSLHGIAFPKGYFSAEDMFEKRNSFNKIFTAEKDGVFLGYVYCEAEPEFSEGDIHFIAVDPAARNKGVGGQLMAECLAFMFSFDDIDEISLCVNADSDSALRLYKAAGFKEEHVLVSYELTV